MLGQPLNENKASTDTIINQLKRLQSDWLESLDDLDRLKTDINSNDLFAGIDYLSYCDHINKEIFINLKEIDESLKFIADHKDHLGLNADAQENLLADLQELKNSMQNRTQIIAEVYPILAESTLRKSQDVISKFANAIQKENRSSSIEDKVSQNLEKQLFLQELKDSLGKYRQSREDYISEIEMDSLRKLPENKIPEDLGEEMPTIDDILSQLDTTITECSSALLIKEITD